MPQGLINCSFGEIWFGSQGTGEYVRNPDRPASLAGYARRAAVPGSHPSHGDVLYDSAESGAQAGSHPASELRNQALCQGRAL